MSSIAGKVKFTLENGEEHIIEVSYPANKSKAIKSIEKQVINWCMKNNIPSGNIMLDRMFMKYYTSSTYKKRPLK